MSGQGRKQNVLVQGKYNSNLFYWTKCQLQVWQYDMGTNVAYQRYEKSEKVAEIGALNLSIQPTFFQSQLGLKI